MIIEKIELSWVISTKYLLNHYTQMQYEKDLIISANVIFKVEIVSC